MHLSKKKYKSPIQIGHLIKHYEKFNELLGTVIITIEDGKYQLVSGLPFLNAARALNLKEIAATYVESFSIRKVNSKKNFKLNQWVENQSVGIGKIIKIDDSYLTVKYDNGSSKTYPIDNAALSCMCYNIFSLITYKMKQRRQPVMDCRRSYLWNLLYAFSALSALRESSNE